MYLAETQTDEYIVVQEETVLKKSAGLESKLAISSPFDALPVPLNERPRVTSPYFRHMKEDRPSTYDGRRTEASSKSASRRIECPQSLSFLWSIQPIDSVYDEKHPPRLLGINAGKGNDIARIWFPNNRAKYFKRRSGNLYRWLNGVSERLPDDYPRPKKKFEVASVFFQARQNNFVAALRDCTREDISDGPYGWIQISFRHHSGLSEVDLGAEKFLLAAPADGSSWMPQVVPEVYNYDTKTPMAKEYKGPPGGLCGKLSLLIAMAAFSAKEEHAEAVVSKCFSYGEWKRHQFNTGIGRKLIQFC
jgi:hypothetical protein